MITNPKDVNRIYFMSLKDVNKIYYINCLSLFPFYTGPMHLTRYTDYSLRVLIYLGAHPEKRSTITQITDHFGISRNHLVKVVHNLAQLGYIKTTRGKSGGMVLAMKPEEINLSAVVQRIEPHLNLLECFDKQSNTCPITMQCKLKGVFFEAKRSFMGILNNYTLADILVSEETEPMASLSEHLVPIPHIQHSE